MTIYTWMAAVFLPSAMNLSINAIIFYRVRSSSRYVNPETIGTRQAPVAHPAMQITRRDLYVLRHMIFMFILLIGGWAPVYTVSCLRLVLTLSTYVFPVSIVIGELCLLSIILNLFAYNKKLRQYLFSLIFQRTSHR